MRLGAPEAAPEAGITFLSSDRQKEGLFMSLSVRENAALSALPHLRSSALCGGASRLAGRGAAH